jgi:PAS domain S-box-containing protein
MRLVVRICSGSQVFCENYSDKPVDLAWARAAAIQKARQMMASDFRKSRLAPPEWFIEIGNDNGQLLEVIPGESILVEPLARERYRDLYAASPHSYLLLTPTFAIIEANPAYQQTTLTDSGLIRGREVFDVFPENPSDPMAQGMDELARSLASAVEHRRTHKMNRLRYDIRNEKGVWLTRYWDVTNVPVLNDNGEIEFIINSVEDVTSAATTDRVLREAEDKGLRFSGDELLSAREKEVLSFVVNGASSKETARELGVSPRTIHAHRANIMRKLNARRASDLIRLVYDRSKAIDDN